MGSILGLKFLSMALKTFVKISNVTNLSDARYSAGMGADVIGFDIDPQSEHYLSHEKAIEIAEWLSGVEFAGEFHSAEVDKLKDVADKYPLSYLEFSHPESAGAISAMGYSAIFKTRLPEKPQDKAFRDMLVFCSSFVDFILIDDIENIEDERVVQDLAKYCGEFPMIIGGDFNSNNILPLLEKVPAKGIALKGSAEIKPGYKDYDELADILEVLEIDDVE